VPRVRVVAVRVAWPVGSSVPVPSGVVPSKNLTVPVAMVDEPIPVTPAVRVTVWPVPAGLGAAVSVVALS